MRYFISAKPRAKKEEVMKIDQTHFKVFVKEPPIDGRANFAIERAFANYFEVSVSRVTIVSGHSSKNKVIEVV